MNERINQLAKKCWDERPEGQLHFDNEKFARLIAEHCAQLCGSQADRRNIRHAFDLPVESQVKYPGPEAYNSVVSQYDREYNLPK